MAGYGKVWLNESKISPTAGRDTYSFAVGRFNAGGANSYLDFYRRPLEVKVISISPYAAEVGTAKICLPCDRIDVLLFTEEEKIHHAVVIRRLAEWCIYFRPRASGMVLKLAVNVRDSFARMKRAPAAA